MKNEEEAKQTSTRKAKQNTTHMNGKDVEEKKAVMMNYN